MIPMEMYLFSYQELRELLKTIQNHATITSMRDYQHHQKPVILRQDIDLDFYPSYEVYKIQKELGIKSTFFILTTSPTYNILSKDIRKKLQEMTTDGFEIGLHFDPTIYNDTDDLQQKAEHEASLLESIIKTKVSSISLHNPSIHGEYPEFKGYLNAYSKVFFEDKRYISDSMRVDPLQHPYRGKNPVEFVTNAQHYPLQIVLHPEQFLPNGGDYIDTITRYTQNTMNRILHDYMNLMHLYRRKSDP